MTEPSKKSDSHLDATQIVPLKGRASSGSPDQGDEDSEGAGRMVGEFRLLRRLGKGGMAEVWLAEQTSLKRNVALKFLKPELNSDDVFIRRFETEAKAAAGLNHPNIVQVYSTGVDDGHHFIAQEYVNGQTLRALLQKRGPLELPLALGIMRQTAAALQAASERGIVHRDIKPENIMITRKGEVKVADFGLAQVNLGGEQLHLTQEGTTMGTPLYMSPEQVHGKPLDQRSDIYSFGVTCYHMLSGQPPFNGASAVAVAVQHVNNEAPPLSKKRQDLPKPVCELVHRMMAKLPEDRYSSAQECLNDIRRLLKALKETGAVNDFQLTAQEKASSGSQSSSFFSRKPILATSLFSLLALLGGAAWGFSQRVHLPVSTGSPYAKLSSAREQFVNAMLKVDDEDAWRAVKHWYPQEKVWVMKANEQLGLLYLRDQRRYSAAESIFRELQLEQANGVEGPRLYAEGTIGLAALHAYKGQIASARNELNRVQDRASLLSPSWNQLRREIEKYVENATGGRPSNRPSPPPPPAETPPPRRDDSQ